MIPSHDIYNTATFDHGFQNQTELGRRTVKIEKRDENRSNPLAIFFFFKETT